MQRTDSSIHLPQALTDDINAYGSSISIIARSWPRSLEKRPTHGISLASGRSCACPTLRVARGFSKHHRHARVPGFVKRFPGDALAVSPLPVEGTRVFFVRLVKLCEVYGLGAQRSRL